MTATAQEVIERFKTLHEFDLRLLRLEKELERAPATLVDRRAAVDVTQKKIDRLAASVRTLRAQMRGRETELKTHEQKIDRLKEQSSEVRSNKEFVAFRSEIANSQGEADRVSNEILKIMEVVEQADAKITEFEAERSRREELVAATKAEIDLRQADVRERRDALLTERPKHNEGLPKEPLELYEKTRRKTGKGAAILEGDYCGACGDMLTKNEVYAVQNRTRIVFCRSCTAMLYLP